MGDPRAASGLTVSQSSGQCASPPQWGSHRPGCFSRVSTPTQQSSHMPGHPPQTPLEPPARPLLLPWPPPGVASTGGVLPIQPEPFLRPAALQSFSHMHRGRYLRAPGLGKMLDDGLQVNTPDSNPPKGAWITARFHLQFSLAGASRASCLNALC